MKCKNCGFKADRDVIGSINIRLRALKMWGVTVPPEDPPMKPEAGRSAATRFTNSAKAAADQNG